MNDIYVNPGRIQKSGIILDDKMKVTWDEKSRELLAEYAGKKTSAIIPSGLVLEIGEGFILVHGLKSHPNSKALAGTFTAIIGNNLQGLVKPWEIKINVQGIGYKIMPGDESDQVKLFLGYSNPKIFTIDSRISFEIVDKNQAMILRCSDRQLLGTCAAKIYDLRPPDSYKGKGVIYDCKRQRKFKKKEVGK